MASKEEIQSMYQMFKKDSNYDTESCLKFLKFLHYKKGEAKYILGMPGLTQIEEAYINQLLEEAPNTKK